MRPSGRAADEMRPVALEIDVNKHAEGSCMVRFGDTQVLCTASIEEAVPRWLRGSGKGWITAEYGMLPRATTTRTDREAARGKQSGRTLEIQRLIGRSLRAVADLKGFGEHLIKIDCDVIQADGGTRTAAVTGAYMALNLAFRHMRSLGAIAGIPLIDQVAAVSCGLYRGAAILDLDYEEDSCVQADANFVLTGKGDIVEIQTTAEERAFSRAEFEALLNLAESGVRQLVQLQRRRLEEFERI